MIDAKDLAYDHDEEALGFGEPPGPEGDGLGTGERWGIGLVVVGLAGLTLAALGALGGWLGFLSAFAPLIGGGLVWISAIYRGATPGIKNDGNYFAGARARGLLGWVIAVGFTAFYVLLYWFPAPLEPLIRVVDPLAHLLAGTAADRWFLYGFLYTAAILVFGVRMFWRYRHNRYQLIRTASVMFFQLGFAFLIPNFLKALNQPEFYPSYFWPLKPDYLFPSGIDYLLSKPGALGAFMVFWGAAMIFLATPILTWFFGKRWYCSWVCGCGGLAETLGDPWRQHSSKSTRAWVVERWMIYSVLVAVTALTALLWIDGAAEGAVFGRFTDSFKEWYGFAIGAMFSGVIGVGFYPIMGARVWCRFGCPMAAVLGIFQRYFSRFRITTNGGQCMSCGNCSTYCEMGIDVRSYAQAGQNIVRASCVGCGICSAVCPRGVLKLENGATHKDRYAGADAPVARFLDELGAPTKPDGDKSHPA